MGAEPPSETARDALYQSASTALQAEQLDEALRLASQLVETDSQDHRARYLRAVIHQQRRDFPAAIADLDQFLKLQPDTYAAYELRGSIKFQAGRIRDSIADFDKQAELQPRREAELWKRGIAFYYAGRDDKKFYERGRKQFEIYQTFDDNDVENAVWRFLCMAPLVGTETAEREILKIKQDRRVPMMEIHGLFAGKLKPADVLAAVEAGNPSPAEHNSRLFYAHLYLGLFHEVHDDLMAARRHLKMAVDHKIGHYMWDVAHVHQQLLEEPVPKKTAD